MWFGGLGFYMSWVVPIGTDVLGSAFDQGMVTRRVTPHINMLAGVALFVMLIDAVVNRGKSRWRRLTKMISVVFMLLLLGGLMWLHPQIDAHIDLNAGSIDDYKGFYALHRYYLWITTFQWLAGWVWLTAYASPKIQNTSPPKH